MISIFEARTTEQTKNNFLIEKNNNFYLSFLKHIYNRFRCIFVLIAKKMQRAILKYFSYIILHGIKLHNMRWDPSFHTFKAYL